MPARLLTSRKQYLASGIHIGTKQRTRQMKEFIYKIRPDGLSILNLKKIDERIRIAGKFLARHTKILVASRKPIAANILKKFSEIVKCEVVTGRFMPGTLTNPSYKKYFEAEIVLVVDPLLDSQVIKETLKARIPVIGICDTFNETKNLDLIIPANNRSAKSLSLLFWLLAREVLKERGEIKTYKDFKLKPEDFVKG